MNTSNLKQRLNLFHSLFFGLLFLPITTLAEPMLSLTAAIESAQANDPWLVANQYQQEALQSQSLAAEVLPDPRVSIGLANLAADSLDPHQENMTQFTVGLSQLFPRGDSLAIQSKKLALKSSQNPHLRADRKLQIELLVTRLWLEIFKAKESLRLIDNNRALFEQLVEISEASYSSAYGNTQQQDIVRAQLELSRLEDNVTKLKQQQLVAEKKLSQWVSGLFTEHYALPTVASETVQIDTRQLPQLELYQPDLLQQDETVTTRLTQILLQHPAVLAVEKLIDVSNADIALAEQQYKPQWGMNASYGYRADDKAGQSRADLLSIGVSFDVPLYTHKKQDRQVQSAIAMSASVKTEKWLLLRKMIAEFKTSKAQLEQLDQRRALYLDKLLPQIHAQAEAALNAYTNDEGDFAEVVRARIDVLNAEIDRLQIDVERQNTLAQLNYFLAPANAQPVKGNDHGVD